MHIDDILRGHHKIPSSPPPRKSGLSVSRRGEEQVQSDVSVKTLTAWSPDCKRLRRAHNLQLSIIFGSPCHKTSLSGQFSTIKRGYFSRYFSHNLHPVNSCSFSTTTIDNDHEGSEQKETISVTFVNKDGEEKLIKVPIGMSMLEAAHQNDIDLEGACEGSLACSTCHVIVMDVDYYKKLEEPVDEENDMLDLAFGLTETSRLGCQVIAKPELDGMRLALPAATRNFAVDGYKPKPH